MQLAPHDSSGDDSPENQGILDNDFALSQFFFMCTWDSSLEMHTPKNCVCEHKKMTVASPIGIYYQVEEAGGGRGKNKIGEYLAFSDSRFNNIS